MLPKSKSLFARMVHILPSGMTLILVAVIVISVINSRSAALAAENVVPTDSAPQSSSSHTETSLLPPVFTITKRDALLVDNDSDTQADPGDTIAYTVVITNTGPDPATGVVFTDTIDTSTTLIAGSVETTPLARNDSYTALGNVRISHLAAAGLLTNDNDPDGGTVTITAFDAISAQGGAVTVNLDGSFSYNPPAGYEGIDTFTYTITDNEGDTDTGIVTITISGMIWFINNNPAACSSACDGRLTNPFTSLAAFQAVNNGAGNNPAAGDNIFLYESATNYTGPVTLLNNQRLIGQDATSSLSALTGLTPPTGSDPLPAMNSGNGVFATITSGSTDVTLGQNNSLHGFTAGNATGTAITGTNFGTLVVSAVTINTTGFALNLSTGTFGTPATFTSITSTGGTNSVNLNAVGGTGNLGTGALSGATNHAFVVTGGTGIISYGGTINSTTARVVSITGKTGGSVTLSGTVTGTSQGVFLDNNGGATISFTGGNMSLNTGANNAFTATGGGTVNVTGAGNTLNTTTGTALLVTNTNIGASNLNFQSIASNGGATPGINLNTTGAAGGLVVTGTGGAGSGGTIQNKSVDAVQFTSTANVNLSSMNITNNMESGIFGTTVTGLTMNGLTITNNGNDGADEGVRINNLFGTSAFTNVTITGSAHNNLWITNSSGTLTSLTITGGSFSNNSPALGNNGILFEAIQTAVVNSVTITGATISANRATGLGVFVIDSGLISAFRVQTSTFTNNNIAMDFSGVDGVGLTGASMNFSILNNTTITGHNSHAINVNMAVPSTGVLQGFVQGNVIGNAVVAGSGSVIGNGIRVVGNSNGDLNLLFDSNNIRQTPNGRGIDIQGRNGTGQIDVTITNNTVNPDDTTGFPLAAIFVHANVAGTAGYTVRSDVRGNNVPAGGTFDLLPTYIALVETAGANMVLVDTPPASASCTAQVAGANTGSASASGTCALIAGPINVPPMALWEENLNDSEGNEISVEQSDEIEETSIILPLTENNIIRRTPLARVETPSTSTTEVDLPVARNAAPMLSGETVNIVIGVLPPGKSITVWFNVTVDNPFPAGDSQVCNQSTVLSNELPPVVSDDPDTPAANDPTCTPISIEADLAITKADGQATAIPGTPITYTITVSNAGPNPDPAAVVADTFPAAITGLTWACVGAGGGTCTAAGSGNINETVNLPVGGSVTFTASGTINPATTGTLANTATVTASAGITDPVPGNNSATDTDTLTPQADVSITKTDGQTTAVPGTTIVYTIVAANTGPSDAPGVTVADTFAAAFTNITWTCIGTGGSTCTAASMGNINDNANLPAGGSVTYTVNATISAAATGSLVNTATASVPGGVTDPIPGNNSATDTDTLTPQADVSITKTDGQTTAIPGTAIVYTIVVSNTGPSDAPGVTVADTFTTTLSGVTWACVGAGGGTCTAAGAGNINDTVNLPAGASVTYTINATIAANASGTLVNTATATVPGGITDPIPGNNSATDTDTLASQADVTIIKSDGQASAVPGAAIVYTIVASNAGPSNAPGTTITDTFAAALTGVTWTCVGAGGGTCTAAGAGNINDTVNLTAGGSVTYTVNATISPDATGTLANTATATVSATVTDPVPGNNSATDTNTLTPQADVAITKSDGQTTAIPGTTITYTIVVSNSGPSNAPTVTITDTFPATLTGVAWTCAGAGGGVCTAAGIGDINDTANLPAGGSVTYTINATISASATGTLSNTATAMPGGGVTDPAPANNSATDTTTLTPEADLSLTKTDGPDPVLAGDMLVYTVTVTNNGPSPAQGVIVTDTLPAGVTLVTTLGCTEDPAGVPTCTLGDILALNSAQFTIAVTVDIGTSGTITNTATVSSSTPDPNPGNNTASAGTTLLEIDFGDAPDPTYPTLLASDGARHLITGPFLGAGVDGEDNGQPNATATGDDGDGSDDEDGVTLPGALVTGSTAAVDVVASAACTLSAWVDFNGDGDWAEANEDIFPGGTALAAGNNSLSFAVPAGATLGTTVSRFRCTTAGAVSFTGLAADGEVEDYLVEIVDNQFSIGDVTALEGNSGDTLFMFTVTRTTNSTAAAVAYATSDGTAVAGLDYTAVPSTTINFTAGGPLTQTAVVTITGDLMFEPDETFTVTLSNPVNGDISDGEAIGTILNEDAPPTLTVANVTNFETAGTFPFTVTLSAVSGLDASVSYSTSDGTAAAGSDYTSTSGSLTIPAGSATGVISVTVLNDALPESTETFTLTLSSPISATIGTGTAVGTIIDDENPPNIISVTDVTAGEAAGLVTFTLSLDTVSGSDVLVDYATNDGTAAAGVDYTAVAGTLTIANGTLSNTVSVPILDDNLAEITETFTLDLSNALNAVILDAQGIGTILDDDEAPIAANDAYTTTEDTALTVPAPGLLANDSDGDGDGLTAVLTTPPTNGAISLNADGSFTYTPTLNFSGSDSFTYQANDGANSSNTAVVTITVLSTDDPGLIYLPIIFNNHVQLPDLVVEEITVLPGGQIEVVITNQGQAPVGANFWVDLYIDPDPLPTAVNQTWTQLADEGLVWGVDDLAALTPGGTLVLSSQDADAQYSNYSGSLASGTVIAVQVDSADVETTFGGVLEQHEILGEPYNNILVVTAP